MAAEDENVDIEDEHAEDQTVKKAAKHDSMRAADLEKVTDYVEEAEILTQNIGDVSCVLNGPIIAIRAVIKHVGDQQRNRDYNKFNCILHLKRMKSHYYQPVA